VFLLPLVPLWGTFAFTVLYVMEGKEVRTEHFPGGPAGRRGGGRV